MKTPQALLKMPNMLSAEEFQYLIWITQEAYHAFGAVVDLGPWLGASSVALAEGLARRGLGGKVWCFDRFEWRPDYMERHSHEGLRHGDDFLPVFLRTTQSHASWIDARRMDLLKGSWDGGPIEILFVDAAKSWDLLNAILRVFGPHLLPSRSRVIYQDFRFAWCYWLPLVCDSQPEVWREVESVRKGDSVTFELHRPLTEMSRWPPDFSEEAFPLSVAEPILRARIAAAEPAHRQNYRLGLLRKLLWEGDRGTADVLAKEAIGDREATAADKRFRNIEERVAKLTTSTTDDLLRAGTDALAAGHRARAVQIAERLAGTAQGEFLRGVVNR